MLYFVIPFIATRFLLYVVVLFRTFYGF